MVWDGPVFVAFLLRGPNPISYVMEISHEPPSQQLPP